MKKYLFVAALLMGLVACAPETPEVKAELSVAETKIEAPQEQNTFSLTIESNTSWNIKCEDDWLFCDPVKGEGDAVIEVTVFVNRTYDERSTVIEIEGKGVADIVTVPVTQTSAKGLFVDNATYQVPAAGGNITVDLQSNVDVEAEIDVDWISLVEPTRALISMQMIFSVAENDATEARAATIVLSGDGVQDKVLNVTQAAKTPDYMVFANAAFKAFLIDNGYDTNEDKEFFASELEAVTSLTLWRRVEGDFFTFATDNIEDLSDLKYLANLEELDIQGVPSSLTSIDLSANTKLRKLNCANTAITEFDLSSNTELVELNLSGTPISTIDLSNNVKMQKLDLRGCPSLSALDVSMLPELTMLNCAYSKVAALNLTGNTALVAFYCSGCSLAELNISALTSLERLVCDDNQLTQLDAGNNVALKSLTCTRNNISSLIVSGLNNLKRLAISHNPISEISLVGNTALNYLHAAFTQLATVDVSASPELWMINANDSKLVNVDLATNEALRGLRINNNLLTSLDINKNVNLRYMFVDGNPTLSAIKVGNWFDPTSASTFIKDSHTEWDCSTKEDGNLDDLTESNGNWE